MVKSTPSFKSWSMSYIHKMKSNLFPSSKITNMLPLYAWSLKNGLTTAQKPCDRQQYHHQRNHQPNLQIMTAQRHIHEILLYPKLRTKGLVFIFLCCSEDYCTDYFTKQHANTPNFYILPIYLHKTKPLQLHDCPHFCKLSIPDYDRSMWA